MVKKLKYLLFLLPFLFITNVNAQTYTLSFNTMRTSSHDLSNSIQCNNTYCVVYDATFLNIPFSFEWGTTGSPTCSSTAVVTGQFFNDNTSFGINNDDYSYNRVYIVPTGSGQQTNCSFSVNDNVTRFVCTASSLSSNFIIGYTLNPTFGGDTTLNSTMFRSMDINCDTSTGQIIENQNQNTQNIINNNTSNTNQIIQNNEQNTQDIINNQNSNTQDIIDNQNQNTQQQIERQKVCSTLDTTTYIERGFLGDNGKVSTGTQYVTDYINIENTEIFISNINSSNQQLRYCFYNSSKTKISCSPSLNLPLNYKLTIPSNSYYFRATTSSVGPFYNICKNGNQALTDSITSEDAPNTSTELNNLDSSVASDTPISDLITLPITLLNVFINGMESSCTPANLGNLYGTDLILPCINIEQRLGSNLWSTIDILFSIFMCYNIGMLFVSAFSGITSLRDDFDSLYQPRHADTGYQPKHGG